MKSFDWKKAFRVCRSVLHRIRRKPGLPTAWRVDGCEQGEGLMVRRAARYSSLDIHEAVFASAPQLKNIEDLDEGIRSRMRHKHACHRRHRMDQAER